MSSVRAVPETGYMTGDELSADDAWHTVRRYGLRHLLSTGFVRFRYGDGFSHARAFALQLALATVPLVIAGAGLATAIGAESFSEVVARTVVAISPVSSDELVGRAVAESGVPEPGEDDDPLTERSEVVVTLGLLTAFAAATSAFAQLERGANRIYGTERDRPALRKYVRATLLTATAGVAMATGLLLIVAGEPFGDALEQVYRWGDAAETVWDVLRWPVGLAALVVAVTALLRFAPRRRQPGLSWLAVGATVTVLLWISGSGLLALYVVLAPTFGDTYGPLTAVMALLLWANLTGVALLAGVALAAQLEAVRVGQDDPRLPDSDDDGIPDKVDADLDTSPR
ncbi:YihY/virulence factor BrkB family protein [Pseudonocardia endophytica]|uniref:YihY family inner membrane protein n=1 Tax=Pseudonocardia endophytica TaxID=401976 RepID=A0A4R1HD54_PSEEN|nr:YihY/virulence factor BrkB family protein [Pseudonocardia endophytica]TCK19974.1 YihY family inner membrane protein [Pseudonocardia endophytica]